jgi:hypothetical protein
MNKKLYKLPFPSTSLLTDPVFEKRVKRTCSLICKYEGSTEDKIDVLTLLFEQVETFRCTYYKACGQYVIDAYDKVIDLGETDWLKEIKSNLLQNGGTADNLTHLMTYFDDGPAYEFICRGFKAETEKT